MAVQSLQTGIADCSPTTDVPALSICIISASRAQEANLVGVEVVQGAGNIQRDAVAQVVPCQARVARQRSAQVPTCRYTGSPHQTSALPG
jgi:hypothetical protein